MRRTLSTTRISSSPGASTSTFRHPSLPTGTWSPSTSTRSTSRAATSPGLSRERRPGTRSSVPTPASGRRHRRPGAATPIGHPRSRHTRNSLPQPGSPPHRPHRGREAVPDRLSAYRRSRATCTASQLPRGQGLYRRGERRPRPGHRVRVPLPRAGRDQCRANRGDPAPRPQHLCRSGPLGPRSQTCEDQSGGPRIPGGRIIHGDSDAEWTVKRNHHRRRRLELVDPAFAATRCQTASPTDGPLLPAWPIWPASRRAAVRGEPVRRAKSA